MRLPLRAGVLVLLVTAGCGRLGLDLVDLPPSDHQPHAPADDAGSPDHEVCPGSSSSTDCGVQGQADASSPCESGDLCACPAADPPSPYARWLLDETSGTVAAEANGGGPAGTLTNFGDAPWTTGQLAGALSFDGIDDHVRVDDLGSSIASVVLWLEPLSPTKVTNQTAAMLPSSAGPDDEWNNADEAYAEDGASAYASALLGNTRRQHWGGFHLQQSLPPGVTILGITVTVQVGNLGLLGNLGVELSWDGGQTHTNADYSWGQLIAGSSDRSAGGPDQLWGRAWAADDLSDQNFRVRASFGGIVSTINIDYVRVQVQYSDYAHPRKILSLGGGPEIAFTGNGLEVAASAWEGATTYVNGAPGTMLNEGFSQLVVVGPALNVNELLFGGVAPAFPYHGVFDDVAVYAERLSPLQIERLYHAPSCLP